jgi:adenylosuccinate lyase
MKNVVENLVIEKERIEAKVNANEKIFSSYVLHQLILSNPTVSREDLYSAVQEVFFKSSNKDELKTNLLDVFNKKKFKHDAETWIDLAHLRKHYVEQFQKILLRLS